MIAATWVIAARADLGHGQAGVAEVGPVGFALLGPLRQVRQEPTRVVAVGR